MFVSQMLKETTKESSMLSYTSLQADNGSKLHIERTIFEHVR